jgi:phosphate transport system protein
LTNELSALNTEPLKLGSLIEQSISYAVEALVNKDLDCAAKAIEFDREVDDKEKEIERRCLKLLLQQQPVAADLRLISTALKMITDMERIGDQASDISEITRRLATQEYIKELRDIPKMADATIDMVKKSVDAFVNRDLELANRVIDSDDVVDDLFNVVKDDLIGLILQTRPAGNTFVDFLMIAKYFERIGDHAVNIAEWVIFSITGR